MNRARVVDHCNSSISSLAPTLRRSVWLLVALASACGSDSGEPSAAAGADVIGPDGGSVHVDALELIIPPGALSKPTKISLAREADVTPASGQEVLLSFELGPSGTVFSVPARALLDHDGPQGDAALYLSDDGKSWTRIADSTFDAARGRWTGSVPHFSHLALQVARGGEAVGGAGGKSGAEGGAGEAPAAAGEGGAAGEPGVVAAGGYSDCDADCAGGAPGEGGAGGERETGVGGIAVTGTEWQRQIGSIDGDRMSDSTTDALGNVVIVGQTSGVLPGASKVGASDAFALKYNPQGDLLFVSQFGTADSESVFGVGRDASHNSYVFGSTDGAFSGFSNAGGEDLFVSKLGPSGALLWTKQLGSSGDEYASGLVTDDSGNSYATGSTTGDLDGQTNQSEGLGELFVIKYDSAGTKQWTRLLGQEGSTTGDAITLGPTGEVYVAATAGEYPGQSSTGARDILTLRYDAAGTVVWGRLWGTVGQDFATSIATDASGNVYVAAEVTDSASGGFVDYVLLKYDSAGDLAWSRRGGVSDKSDYVGAVTTDASGNAYVTGRTAGALDSQSSAGSEDAYLIKFAPDGTRKWTRQFGTNLTDWGSSVAGDAAGNLYASGLTKGGLGGKVTQTGEFQIFLLKFPTSALAD